MLDAKFVRENGDAVAAAMAHRNAPWDASRFAQLDETRRVAITREEALQAERNAASKQIGQMMAAGQREEAEVAKERVREVNEELETIGRERDEADSALRDLLLSVPNLPDASVPVGADEDETWRCAAGAPRATSAPTASIPRPIGTWAPTWTSSTSSAA